MPSTVAGRLVQILDPRRIYRSDALFTAGTQATTAAISLVSGPVLARVVGASGRGDVAAVLTTLTVLTWIGFLGLPNSAGYFSKSGRPGRTGSLALLAAVAGALVGLALFLSAPSFAAGHDHVTVVGLRCGAVLLPLIGVGQTGQEILYAQGRLRTWNLIRSVPVTGAAVTILVLGVTGRLGIGTAVAANLGAIAAWIVLALVTTRSYFHARLTLHELRAPLSYGVQAYLAGMSLALFGRLDQILMVPFSRPAELGRYAVAVTVVASANLIPSAIGIVAYPKMRGSSLALVLDHFTASRRKMLRLSLVVNALVVAVVPFAVPALYGPDFVGMTAVFVLLAGGQILNDLWGLLVSTMNGLGTPRYLIAPSWVALAATLGVLLATSPGGISPAGAAAATLVGAAVRPLAFRLIAGTLAGIAAAKPPAPAQVLPQVGAASTTLHHPKRTLLGEHGAGRICKNEPMEQSGHGRATNARLDQIPGWLGNQDRTLFRWFLSEQDRAGERGDLAELGVYMGQSAVLIGDHVGPADAFTVVDLFESSPDTADNLAENRTSYSGLSQQRFEDYYRAVHPALPTVVRGLSHEITLHARSQAHRFIHIDASHLYDQVRLDIAAARTLVQDGGVVVFDDIRSAHTPGVAAAVWQEVTARRLNVLVVGEVKLYATWSDPSEWRARLHRWLPSSGLPWEEQSIAGKPTLRVGPVQVERTNGGVARRLVRAVAPPAATAAYSRLRATRAASSQRT